MADSGLLSDIAKGAELKHAETVDKSGPVIEEGTTIKESQRPALMADITKGAELKHAETVDKSGPVIEEGTTVKESQRPALLAEIKSKGGD